MGETDMKVHDFARRLGLPDSKVRYYDQAGLIRGGRQKENNYRDLTGQDALNIYHAQMLRSFGMGVQEALAAQGQGAGAADRLGGDAPAAAAGDAGLLLCDRVPQGAAGTKLCG